MKCLKIENRYTSFTLELSEDEVKMIVAALGSMGDPDMRCELKAMEFTTDTPTEMLDSYPLYQTLRDLVDKHNN